MASRERTFEVVLETARAEAKRDRDVAARRVMEDRHPDFWTYAADLTGRWLTALDTEPLDWNALSALRDEAHSESSRAGVWLFAVCARMEADFIALRDSSLLR